jgi:adenosine deaminase
MEKEYFMSSQTLSTQLSETAIRALPKVELHLHLDTSVRINTVADLSRQYGLNLPSDLEDALIVPMNCNSLNEYLSRVEHEVAVLQTPAAIERATYELLLDCAQDSIYYAEIRFAPQLCTRQGLKLAEVIEASARGVRQARQDAGIKAGLLMCLLRHENEAMGLQVVRAALEAREKGLPVVGLDIAADESLPGEPHVAAFKVAQRENLHRTCHAGEAVGPESIAYALDVFGAERIGHGVRLREDPQLLARVKREGIALEMCPTSNVQTKATPTLDQHPANTYLQQGLQVTINCDGRTTSNTNLTHEYVLMSEQFGWGEEEIRQTALNAAAASFMPPADKQSLIDQIKHGYNH